MDRLPEVAPELSAEQVIEAGRTDTDPDLKSYYLAAMRQQAAWRAYVAVKKRRLDLVEPLSANESREYMTLLGLEANALKKSARLQELAVRYQMSQERAESVSEVGAHQAEFLSRSEEVARARAVLDAKAAHQAAEAKAAAAVERARAEAEAKTAATKAELARASAAAHDPTTAGSSTTHFPRVD